MIIRMISYLVTDVFINIIDYQIPFSNQIQSW